MKRLSIVAILTAGILAALLLVAPSGPRSLRTFDPDQGGDHADWTTVGDLLRQSFRELHASVQ